MSSPTQIINLLAQLNELTVHAFSAKNKNSLIYIVLNETAKVIPFDRAMLWDLRGSKPALLGVSGHAKVPKDSEIAKTVAQFVKDLVEPSKIKAVTAETFSTEGQAFQQWHDGSTQSSVIWVPIVVDNHLELGLWIERWNDKNWDEQELKLFSHLSRGFSAAFQKFLPKIPLNPKAKMALKIFGATVLLFVFFFPISLRIVAPCEVVAKDPYLVTAPLNGIIDQVMVKPGEVVTKGAVLFQYNKQVPLQELKVAEKEVEIANSQLNRVMTKGFDDAESLNEAGIWRLQLDRDNVKLDLAKYQASKLEVVAETDGFIALDDPDQWRGRPVQIGERVMMIVNPENTKLKIWISESDNISYLPDENIDIILNIDPAETYTAKIRYVSDYSLLSATGVTSFVAEADWVEKPESVKIGLKGTAVLFGEYVPFFYWVLRKPLIALRHMIGY